MSVLVEALSVVVRISTIEEKYPGGLLGYAADCPNRTFCADDHLCRVGFMVPDDVGEFVRQLARAGLVPFHQNVSVDVVVLDQLIGPTTPCDWIEGGRFPEGFSAAWLAGTEPGPLCAPEGWTVAQSKGLHFISNEEAPDRLVELANDDGQMTVLDLNTGQERFFSRIRRGKP